jgi:hypothetical protein
MDACGCTPLAGFVKNEKVGGGCSADGGGARVEPKEGAGRVAEVVAPSIVLFAA